MPNVEVLKRQLELSLEGDTVQPIVAMDVFNAGLRDLATVARIPGKVTISFLKGDKSLTLPTDIVEIREVEIYFNNGTEITIDDLHPRYGMKVDENTTIEWKKDLEDDGHVVVKYYRYPQSITTLSDVPEIPEIFHDALVHFGTREVLDGDDEDGRKADMKYQRKKAELDLHTKNRGMSSKPVKTDARPPWARR